MLKLFHKLVLLKGEYEICIFNCLRNNIYCVDKCEDATFDEEKTSLSEEEVMRKLSDFLTKIKQEN